MIGIVSIIGVPRVFCLTEYGAQFFTKGTSLNSQPERDDEHLV